MNRRPWWRLPLLTYAAIALVCGALVLSYSLDFWRPCYIDGYGSPACAALQSNTMGPDPSPGLLYIPWLVTLGASIVQWILTAVARHRDGLGWSAAATLVVLFFGNPFADYLLTPYFNGGYMSHDDHPGLGIPVAASLFASGLFALIGACWPKSTPRRLQSTATTPTAD